MRQWMHRKKNIQTTCLLNNAIFVENAINFTQEISCKVNDENRKKLMDLIINWQFLISN